jgi:hypothetical protein
MIRLLHGLPGLPFGLPIAAVFDIMSVGLEE